MAWELASFPADLLRVDADRIQALARAEAALEGVKVDIAGPWQPVRITHVLDAVGPRARPAGVAVVPCLDFPGEERPLHEQDGIIYCAGPGAGVTPFGAMTNVVLTFKPVAGAGHAAVDNAVRKVTLAAAELLAEPTLSAEPEAIERFELGPSVPGLPSIAALVQLSDLGQLYFQFVYGVPAGEA